jgi:CheY-like chemotaxis protein
MSISGAGVLLVTPYSDERDMYTDFLCHLGFDVSVCAHLDEAPGLAAAAQVEVAVIRLPDRSLADAVAVLERLRTDSRTRRLGLIAITTHPGLEYRHAAAIACDGFILLPSPPEDLVSAIERIVRDRQRSAQRDPQHDAIVDRAHGHQP